MKSGYLFKIILLALPVLLLIYVFFVRDRLDSDGGIGGGGYDLTKMYTLIATGVYLLILNLVLLIQNARDNRLLLLLGMIALIWTVTAAVRSF